MVVRTFLFLTMDGTPEGDALQRTLRLARDDKGYLGLDDFRMFLSTDLTLDDRLAEILAGRGCGGLFELGRQVGAGARKAGQAELVSRHLGLEFAPGAAAQSSK